MNSNDFEMFLTLMNTRLNIPRSQIPVRLKDFLMKGKKQHYKKVICEDCLTSLLALRKNSKIEKNELISNKHQGRQDLNINEQ